MTTPIICFGQQPCGFFPKRFLVAKIRTGLRLQSEIGGEIVFFFHDSDHDPRETRTILRHRRTDEPTQLNFAFKNSIQRRFSPLYLKEIPDGWQDKTARQLPNYISHGLAEIFQMSSAVNVADFCLEIYRQMGLLDQISVFRSSTPSFRQAACKVEEFFVDVPYEGEIVRARFIDGTLKLHKGGDSFVTVPKIDFTKLQISPTRDTRLPWMQSVVNCSHYIHGAGEKDYLHPEQNSEIQFIHRDPIDRFDEAYTELP
jgi:hypothetical protein